MKIINLIALLLIVAIIGWIIAPYLINGIMYIIEWTLRRSDDDRPEHTPFHNYDDQKEELNMGSYLFI